MITDSQGHPRRCGDLEEGTGREGRKEGGIKGRTDLKEGRLRVRRNKAVHVELTTSDWFDCFIQGLIQEKKGGHPPHGPGHGDPTDPGTPQ